jgi:hypothetical protein
MLAMAGRAGMFARRVRLVKRVRRVTAPAVFVNGRHCGRRRRGERANLKRPGRRAESGREPLARAGLRVAMTRGATRRRVRRAAGHFRERRGGVLRGKRAGIDELRAERTAQHEEQHRRGESDHRNREPLPLRPQAAPRNALGDWAAARAVGARAACTWAAAFRRARATPAAFRFAGLGFKHGLAFGGGAATASGVRPDATRLAFAVLAANPVQIRARVLARVEVGPGRLFFHRAPPEKADTMTMCASVQSSSA